MAAAPFLGQPAGDLSTDRDPEIMQRLQNGDERRVNQIVANR